MVSYTSFDPHKDNTFLTDVEQELGRARAKYPSSECCLAAMSEEAGEVAKAMLEGTMEDIYEECVQLAAMAARIALEGDETLLHYRYAHGARTPAVGKRPVPRAPAKAVTISNENPQWTKAEIVAAEARAGAHPVQLDRRLPPLVESGDKTDRLVELQTLDTMITNLKDDSHAKRRRLKLTTGVKWRRDNPVVICGARGFTAARNAAALAEYFGCGVIMDEWDGVSELTGPVLALTTIVSGDVMKRWRLHYTVWDIDDAINLMNHP